MAITLADFTKIWASTSPLTPYSFSDSNYQEGWNFVGSTPPARQMWDSYMKWSDEKQQYIVNNFLPLSGGTMTGAININGNAVNMGADSSADGRIYTITNYLRLTGGNSTSNGSWIDIGSASSSILGISLNASDGNGTTKTLKVESNGNLSWDENDITPQTATESQSSQDTSLSSGTQSTVYSFTLTKGTWMLVGRIYFPTNSNGYRSAWFSASDNGSAISSQARCTALPPSGSACWIQVMYILSVSSSTTYYLVASQNSGSTLNASGGVVKFRLSSIV